MSCNVLAAYYFKAQHEMVHFNSFVYDENLSGEPLHNERYSFRSYRKLQICNMALLEHLARFLIDRYLLHEEVLTRVIINWLRFYVINQT